MRSWTWIGRYALVLLAAVALGAAIGELTVFKTTTLGTPKLSAAAFAKFLGYGGALVVFALLGQRAASQLRASGERHGTPRVPRASAHSLDRPQRGVRRRAGDPAPIPRPGPQEPVQLALRAGHLSLCSVAGGSAAPAFGGPGRALEERVRACAKLRVLRRSAADTRPVLRRVWEGRPSLTATRSRRRRGSPGPGKGLAQKETAT